MARINYTKEWQRIIINLERTEARFIQELYAVGTEEERNVTVAKLLQVREQLAHARNEHERMRLVKPRYAKTGD